MLFGLPCIENAHIKNINSIHYRISIRKTFVQFLRNATQFFFSLRIRFAQKKQKLAQSFAKVILCKIALFRFCATRVLRNSAISLKSCMCFSWNQKIFSRYLNSGKILFWNVLLLVTFAYLTNDSQDEFRSHGRTPYW